VIQDLTRQRHAEQAAQREREAMARADKMISLGVLVSGVAHEINNPNHAILLNAPLLREAWKSIVPIVGDFASRQDGLRVGGLPWAEMKVEAASMIDDVEHAAERVRGIVTELRGFARSHDSGEHKALFINDVVQSSLRLLGNHIRKATSAFSVTLVHGLPAVRGNAQRLEQIIVNLVLNSCQALDSPEAMVSIETGRTEAHVFVRVADAGRGIVHEDLAMIKDPFFTTKRAEGGSGLGLAVSETIVQEHGGELTFDSAPGRGTVATLLLPVGDA
jgi:polar amino acid transport system substrate-binding protein